MFDLVILLILGFASYRITRFFIIDTFFEGSRAKLHTFFANSAEKHEKTAVIWEKMLDLTSCTFCFGFWVSLVVYSLYQWICPVDFSRVDVINVFAVAGIQSMIHALEPDSD